MRLIYSLLLASTLLVSCINHAGVDKTLSLAGENRTELEKVLTHLGALTPSGGTCFQTPGNLNPYSGKEIKFPSLWVIVL